MRALRQTLASAFSLVVLPYFGFFLARQFDDNARLVGGYLLVSPLIALWVGAIFSGLLGWRSNKSERRPSTPDRNLVEQIAMRSGIENPKLDSAILVGSNRGAGFDYETNCVYLIEPIWGKLSSAARRFAVARAIAETQSQRQNKLSRELLKWMILLIGSALSSLNLWLILLIQSGTVISLVKYSFVKQRAHLLRDDATALSRCGNLMGAKEWVKLQSNYPTLSIEERINQLEFQATDG